MTGLDGALQPDGAYDESRFTGDDLRGADCRDARFLDCVVEDADLTEARLSGTRWTDCRMLRVRGVGTELVEAVLQGGEVVGARLGALAAHGSSWRGVRVVGGKVDYLNLRGATLREVTFEDCVLVEPDFAEATLVDVTFDGCTLVSPEWGRASLTGVDLSRARLVAPLGLTSLGGATISRSQLIELADAFATQLGVQVRD